ncbi:OST-HTH associated domain [Arabidopsis thaliana x Arabidopsis arenosa]|uniref:OST-HTH associated domain n=1 Tax=Arabidopsis thaliana x Arabidopsis arenosa TaxID=1240361 RepID=A0A8T1XWS4_9BRAS|nr:OST-HTH associated domain [Arabidopsis thaliana x Arabidopsis arenosa]
MQFGSSKSLFFRLAGFSSTSVFKPPRAISVLVANFSSSSSISGHFNSLRRHQYEEESRSVRVHVWWDFENCHLPSGANVFKLAQTITSAVRISGMKGPITITAFGDLIQLSRTNQEALFATGINLTHVPQGGKNSTDRSLITDLMWWVLQNPPPAHIFLITSDRDFANVLHRLRMNNYNILLAGYEEATHGVLCSAASIMWDWDALVRGKNPTGKYYNQPPDGPYNSWYGHYRTPLLDPFATSSTTTNKQISCTSVKTIELVESNSNATNSGSSKACLPVPKGVVKQIGLILSWYPKGAPITELREQLRKRKVHLDRDFYGYKSFSRFLLSMPKILQVVPLGDGMFSIHAVTQGMNNKASSPNVTSENHEVVSLDKMCEDMKQSDKNVKEESQLQENSQESVQVIRQIDVKAKEEPVKTTQLALTVVDDVSPSEEKDGFLKKLNRLWFGSPEIVELEHLEEKKYISGNGDEGKGVVGEEKVVNTDLESRIASSTSSESAEEVKADTEVGNEKSKSPWLLRRLLRRFTFSWGGNIELSNATVTGPQVDDVFAKDSFWMDIESFINSPRGFVLVSHSRSREAMAKNLKEEGPSSLKPLDVSKMLDLVSMLITEKKWIQENPADALPFRVTWFTEKSSCLSNPPATEGLRSIFVNMSKSLCDKANGEKKIKDVGMSQKPKERLRSQVIADCHKLIKKIRKENPGGYNMSNFKKDFLVKFGYRLEHHNLGYPKLQSLIQMIPEARIESGYIVPSSTPVPYESDSLFEDLGPVSKKVHENESSVSEEEGYNSETDEEASVKQNDEERKKKKEDETECDLLQILGSWDTDKKQKKSAKTFGEDKLVEGILLSLRKKPSGDSRIHD